MLVTYQDGTALYFDDAEAQAKASALKGAARVIAEIPLAALIEYRAAMRGEYGLPAEARGEEPRALWPSLITPSVSTPKEK